MDLKFILKLMLVRHFQRLESLALQICLIEQKLTPTLHRPCHLLFGADHGIEREGVSVSPREITWQQMINFTRGGGGVNMFCRQHGFKLRIVDVGVDYDLAMYPDIINRKIANGTGNFLYEPAMSVEQYQQALNVGAEMADACFNDGSDIICIGEMGIANKAVENFKSSSVDCSNAEEIIRYFGGFEMVAAIGAMLRAAECHLVIMVDGFIMTACALAASRLYPEIVDYMVFGHSGDEGGHARMLGLLNAKPLLSLGLRLGEGTGALCSFPIIDSAVRMINEMNNFQNANITKYF